MLENHGDDRERRLARRITDALVEEDGARREATIAAFHKVAKESYASGSELMADKSPPK